MIKHEAIARLFSNGFRYFTQLSALHDGALPEVRGPWSQHGTGVQNEAACWAEPVL